MGWTCAPQLIGLVRGEPKQGQKHRANGKAICGELGKERYTNSATFDDSRSNLNKYEHIDGLSDSGFDCWDYLCDKAEQYKVRGKTKNGKEFTRSLKSDAVVGFALIVNPPENVCVHWSDDEYDKFYEDTAGFLYELEPRIFNPDNYVFQAEHFDEGLNQEGKSRHLHVVGIPLDENGKYCGNLIDPKLYTRINEAYPKYMRDHGWKDFEDLETTDWTRYKTDAKYKATVDEKRKHTGQSTNKYIERKTAKQAIKDAERANEVAGLAEQLADAMDKNEKMSADLAEYEKDLQARESDLQAREDDLQAQQDKYAKMMQKAQIEQNTALQMQKKAEERELALDAREAKLENMESRRIRGDKAASNVNTRAMLQKDDTQYQ